MIRPWFIDAHSVRRYIEGSSWFRVCWCGLICLPLWTAILGQAATPSNTNPDKLVIRAGQNRVDAQIGHWSLLQLLQQISTQTGWQVYMEPGTDQPISVKFQNLEVREALSRLLGSLNFALLPQQLGGAKLFIYRTSVQGATELVPPLNSDKEKKSPADKIPNELIVSVKSGSKTDINELAKSLGAKVVGRADGLNSYRLKFDNETSANAARQTLASNSEVDSVDSNYILQQPTQLQNSSLSASRLQVKAKAGNDPNQIVIGLIDTAVQPQTGNLKDFLLQGLSVAGESQPAGDTPSHGTAMAETILAGIAAANQSSSGVSARILPVDVYGPNENTTSFDVANGIYEAIKGGADMINLSLGGSSDSEFLHEVITAAHEKGISFVAAAGNEPGQDPIYPAAYAEVTAVTAGDKQGIIASYANRSDYVSIVAPGGNTIQFNNLSYYFTGTSVSSAYTSGLIAGVAESSKKPIAEADKQVRSLLPVKKP